MPMTTSFSPRPVLAGTLILSLLPFLMVFALLEDPFRMMDKASYLVFHNFSEFFSIMVSLSVFSVGWYTYHQSKDQRALFVGAAFLAVGLLDVMHTLGNAAMPAFITQNSANKSTQFWIAARLLAASTFLASAFIDPAKQKRWISRTTMLAASLALTACIFAAVTFYPEHVPATAVPGVGLTPLKRYLEFAVIVLLACSFVVYWRRFEKTGDRNLLFFLAAFIICIFSEAAFASYKTGYDAFNVLGHIYKVAAFYLIYKGVFASAVRKPYLHLSHANEKLLRLNRLYTVLSETNKCIVRATDRGALFRDICRVAVEHGGLQMAWVGILDETTGRVEPVASSGSGDGLLNINDIRNGADTETVTGAAIREGCLKICGDVVNDARAGRSRGDEEKRGFRSSAAIALNMDGKAIGALTMYAGEANFFGCQMADLLSQMSSDISFALDRLEGEACRREVEIALQDEILERIRVIEELHEKDQLLMQQSRLAAMGEMINNIAHQWRQPLNVVGLIVQELQTRHDQGDITNELFREKVADVMKVLQHMSQTIDDFRTFFRPNKKKEYFQVAQLVPKVFSLVDGSFRKMEIRLDSNLADTTVICGYPNEYSQVLLNILVNARDAFSECATDCQRVVSISAFTESGRSVVTIADNAGGIPEEIIHKVFDPYFTTKGPDKGTGVGLYMSKLIVDKSMNGTLTVCNTHDGAQFRIEIPCSIPDVAGAPPSGLIAV